MALTSYGSSNGTSGGTTSTSPGNVFVSTYTGTNNNQLWYFEETGYAQTSGIANQQIYYIKNKYSSKYLDVSRNSTAPGTPTQQYKLGDYPSERWKITYAQNGYYNIQSMLGSNLYLDSLSNPINHTQVLINPKDGTNGQLWKIVKNSDGTYRLSPKSNEYSMALCINNASTANNALAITHIYNASQNDQWIFEKAPVSGTDYKLVTSSSSNPGYATDTIPIKITNVSESTLLTGDRWINVVSAYLSWNIKAGTSIKSDSNSTNTVAVGEFSGYPSNVVGAYQAKTKSGGHATSFRIRIIQQNVQTYVDDPKLALTSAEKEKVWANVTMHELGHALGLEDNPTGMDSIMKQNRNKWVTEYPYFSDIIGVCDYYNR